MFGNFSKNSSNKSGRRSGNRSIPAVPRRSISMPESHTLQDAPERRKIVIEPVQEKQQEEVVKPSEVERRNIEEPHVEARQKKTVLVKKADTAAIAVDWTDDVVVDKRSYADDPAISKIISPFSNTEFSDERASDDALFAYDKKLEYRHELKYYINDHDYMLLRQSLKAILKTDPHADENNSYHIRSLYLDDRDDSSLVQKIEGSDDRSKYRIRIYNYGRDGGVIRFEKKIKHGQFIAKRSFVMSMDEYLAFCNGDIGFLLKRKEPLAREIYLKMTNEGLAPKVVVDYEREAYIMDVERVRITFDKNLHAGIIVGNIFDPFMPVMPVADMGKTILEVKFNRFLPDYIKGVLSCMTAPQRSAISKYAICRKYE